MSKYWLFKNPIPPARLPIARLNALSFAQSFEPQSTLASALLRCLLGTLFHLASEPSALARNHRRSPMAHIWPPHGFFKRQKDKRHEQQRLLTREAQKFVGIFVGINIYHIENIYINQFLSV
ncbi:MAG TPA: hypothetical protein VIE66_09560 [Methylocella sp.]|jgi:hypothetical protein